MEVDSLPPSLSSRESRCPIYFSHQPHGYPPGCYDESWPLIRPGCLWSNQQVLLGFKGRLVEVTTHPSDLRTQMVITKQPVQLSPFTDCLLTVRFAESGGVRLEGPFLRGWGVSAHLPGSWHVSPRSPALLSPRLPDRKSVV